AVAESLMAPSTLMRQCVRDTKVDGPLRAGTLVVFRLGRMHRGTESDDLALARRQWNQCPAQAIVPRLLGDVWQAAVAIAATRRYRVRRSLVYRLLGVPAIRLFAALNRRVPWYRLPVWLGYLNLSALRSVPRRRNLHDTSLLPTTPTGPPPVA